MAPVLPKTVLNTVSEVCYTVKPQHESAEWNSNTGSYHDSSRIITADAQVQFYATARGTYS
jgi:hypothetical protein